MWQVSRSRAAPKSNFAFFIHISREHRHLDSTKKSRNVIELLPHKCTQTPHVPNNRAQIAFV